MEPMGTMGLPGDGPTDPKARGRCCSCEARCSKPWARSCSNMAKRSNRPHRATGRHAARRDAVKGGQG